MLLVIFADEILGIEMQNSDLIVAPATAAGGAISVIRLSGKGAVCAADAIFRGSRPLSAARGGTVHYGHIEDENGVFVDDVLAAVFRAPHSYTGQESVELSCHGSRYIVSRILQLLVAAGARMARPGEFTSRAFLAGKIDLAQAEAVADMIASDSQASLAIASTQMRGGYSLELDSLRENLLKITSLLELELDFSEEDVQFADRSTLRQMLCSVKRRVDSLCESFATGNAIKNGVGVAIVGRPNVGKSTLLNKILGEQRAMVSDIAGTTRDSIEESVVIDGVTFRFIDTAGIHDTADMLERMGIERTMQIIDNARIILQLCEPECPDAPVCVSDKQILIRVFNKTDISDVRPVEDAVYISAKTGHGVDILLHRLRDCVDTDSVYNGEAVVSSLRHYEALDIASQSLARALDGMDNDIPSDLLSEEIRQVIHSLGEITGHITSDEILSSIFSKFCIGK